LKSGTCQQKLENWNLKNRSVKVGIYQQKPEKFCAEIKKQIIENNTQKLRAEKRKHENWILPTEA
jgi:hypothetical protein